MTAVPISETLKVAQEVHELIGSMLLDDHNNHDELQNALELQAIVISDLELDMEEGS